MQNNNASTYIDKLEIDNITKMFFAIFSNANQKQPDWRIINNIFIPEAIIIKKNDAKEVVYNLQSFVEPRRKILTDGTIINFEETEIKEETIIAGNIAQRISRYQKSGYLNGAYFKEYGNKFFQFIQTNKGWKINSLIWEDDKL